MSEAKDRTMFQTEYAKRTFVCYTTPKGSVHIERGLAESVEEATGLDAFDTLAALKGLIHQHKQQLGSMSIGQQEGWMQSVLSNGKVIRLSPPIYYVVSVDADHYYMSASALMPWR